MKRQTTDLEIYSKLFFRKDVAVKQENGSDDGYGSNQFDVRYALPFSIKSFTLIPAN